MPPAPAHTFSFDWSYPCAFVWGLLVLLALIGWGQALARWLVPDWDAADWGFPATLGMTAFLLLAGFAMMLSLFSKIFLLLFLAAGFALLLWTFPSLRWKAIATLPKNRALKFAFLGLALLAALEYAAAAALHWYNEYDDFIAYFAHAKMMLDTGTFYDPFSFRLLASTGGQQALSTLVVAFLPWKYANLLDGGIGLLIILGLAGALIRGNDDKNWAARLLPLAFLLAFTIQRANTASELTGTALFLALLLGFDLATSGRSPGYRAAILLAAVLAAASSLRANYVFTLGALTFTFFAWRCWENKGKTPEIIREALLTLGLYILFSAPYWLVEYRSSGAFLYPLFKGTQRPDFDIYTVHLTALDLLLFLGGFFVLTNYLLLFLPALFLRPGRRQTTLLLYAGAILLVSIPCILELTKALYVEIYRYLTPMALAFCLYTLAALSQELIAAWPTPARPGLPLKLALLGLIFLGIGLGEIFPRTFRDSLRKELHFFRDNNPLDANSPMMDLNLLPAPTDQAQTDYPQAFSHVPTGSKILIALDFPFLLDYRAHRIFSIDMVGVASPAPGFPCFRGAQPIKQYLLAQGIRYIAHVPFNNGLGPYYRANWETAIWDKATPVFGKYELDFDDNIDQLARTNHILYDSTTIRVIDLGD